MIPGFAAVAWPAEYDSSEIMAFIVNHRRKVYQRNLGPETAELVAAMGGLRPASTWSMVTN
jgi:hypothetical protein